MLKWIYAARRAENTTPAEFAANWRRHAALSESFPDITRTFARNTQATTVRGSRCPGLEESFDGMCFLDLTSLGAAAEVYAREGIPQMMADESRIFAQPSATTQLTALECVVEPGPRGQAVLVELVQRAPGEDDREFFAQWSRLHVERLMAVEGFAKRVRRIAHNHVVAAPPPEFPYDGVGEMWFDDVANALSAAEALHEITSGELVVGPRALLTVNYVWTEKPHDGV